MDIEPYLCIGGVEVINHARTETYLRNPAAAASAVGAAHIVGCSAYGEDCIAPCTWQGGMAINGGPGYGEEYVAGIWDFSGAGPAFVGNPAPWYTAGLDPGELAGAYGLWVTSATTTLVYQDGQEDDELAPCPYRLIEFQGVAMARDACSLKGWERWFRMMVSRCQSDCTGASLGWLDCCSPEFVTSQGDDRWRMADDAKLSELTIERDEEQDLGRHASGCSARVVVRFKVRVPQASGVWRSPDVNGRYVKLPSAPTQCWDWDYHCSCVAPGVYCDTVCSPLPVAPTKEHLPSCYCFPYLYRQASQDLLLGAASFPPHLPALAGSHWVSHVFGITVHSGALGVKDLRFDFYRASDVVSGTPVACATPCHSIAIAEIPPNSTLWFDGTSETAGISCPGGERGLGSLVEGLEDGWPVQVGEDWTLVVTASELTTSADARYWVRRAAQYDRCLSSGVV